MVDRYDGKIATRVEWEVGKRMPFCHLADLDRPPVLEAHRFAILERLDAFHFIVFAIPPYLPV